MSHDNNNNETSTNKNPPNHNLNRNHRNPNAPPPVVMVDSFNKSKSAFDKQLHPSQEAKGAQQLGWSDASQDNDGKLAEDDEDMTKKVKTAKQYKKWNRRLKIFFCCLGYKKNKDSIGDVASIFAEFYADLNVSSSDFAAGMVLLSKYQAAQQEWIVKNGSQRLKTNNQKVQINDCRNYTELGHTTQQQSLRVQSNGVLPSGGPQEDKDNDQIIEQYLSTVPITGATKFVDISTAQDSHLINDLIYYMNYSLAIFGWPLQMVDDPCMLCCICPYLRFGSCLPCSIRRGRRSPVGGGAPSSSCADENNDINKKSSLKKNQKDQMKKKDRRKSKELDSAVVGPMGGAPEAPPVGELAADCDRPIVLEDNCCGCNAASAECRLAAHNYEIIYVSYKVKVNVVPFLVAADHSKQTVVVAIRGSMSLSDMVTDMNGQTDRLTLDESACPDDWLCHRGIAKASNYVKDTLLGEQRILERAFSCRPDLGSREYNLLLCGHSLGAGVAAILGLLLQPRYPQLKAYLYSPPGGILSASAVEETKKFAYGIMLGNDIVPRLGIAQLERLRYHVLLSLKSSHKSSGNILARALCPSCCVADNQVDYDPSQSINLLHGTGGRSFDYNGSKIPFQVQPQLLYVPGRLIHIVKNQMANRSRASRLFKQQPIFQAVWTDNTNYDRVIIGEGMFYDHLPNRLMHAMKMLFSKTLPARRESANTNTGTNPTVSPRWSPSSSPLHSPDDTGNGRPQTGAEKLGVTCVEELAISQDDDDDQDDDDANKGAGIKPLRKLASDEQVDSNGNGAVVENKNLNHAH